MEIKEVEWVATEVCRMSSVVHMRACICAYVARTKESRVSLGDSGMSCDVMFIIHSPNHNWYTIRCPSFLRSCISDNLRGFYHSEPMIFNRNFKAYVNTSWWDPLMIGQMDFNKSVSPTLCFSPHPLPRFCAFMYSPVICKMHHLRQSSLPNEVRSSSPIVLVDGFSSIIGIPSNFSAVFISRLPYSIPPQLFHLKLAT